MGAAHGEGSNETGLLGLKWFIGGGIVAVAFSFFLVWADDTLSNSKREEIVNQTMKEIRTAQSSLPSRVTDPRQLFTFDSGAAHDSGHGDAGHDHSEDAESHASH